jgi:threonine/homoserine/homoserine lactone efflux protein
MTILSFAAVFAALGVGSRDGGYLGAALMVTGVFIGSAIWWLILSGVTATLRSRLQPRHLRQINRLSGIIFLGFGVMCFITLLK